MGDMRRIVPVGAVLLALLAGCARPQPAAAGPLYRAGGVVLENRGHGPQLCNHLLQSNPPTCEGLELVGWDWAAVEGEVSAHGTTWGGYEVVGTWDGGRITVVEVRPAPPEPTGSPPAGGRPFPSPCPEPDGGWRVVDPATTTTETWVAVIEAARARPDYGGDWIDQPGLDNDPGKMIINVLVTGSVAEAERDLRRLWGGSLCVSPAARTEAEARSIERELATLAGGSASVSYDVLTQSFTVDLLLDDGSLQATYDRRYGPGTVTVRSWFQPAA